MTSFFNYGHFGFYVEAKLILVRIYKKSLKHEFDSVDEYQICHGMMLCQVAHKI